MKDNIFIGFTGLNGFVNKIFLPLYTTWYSDLFTYLIKKTSFRYGLEHFQEVNQYSTVAFIYLPAMLSALEWDKNITTALKNWPTTFLYHVF